jgi:DNA-binding GntR family transcriptional regulator
LPSRSYRVPKSDIFEFRLLPGTRFSENEVAGRARVSRTPVREALFRLQREGYLQVHPKSGWSVRPLDFDLLDDLYDLRLVLEIAAVQRLYAGDPKAALAGLEKVWLVAPRSRLTDGARVARLDEEFHTTLVESAGNPELARVHQSITERIRIVRRLDFTHPERVVYTYLEHGQTARGVARRPARAVQLLKSHIEGSKRSAQNQPVTGCDLAHIDSRS